MWLDLSVGKSPTEQEVDDVPTKPARPAAPGGAVHVAPQVRQADLPLHHGRPARDPRPRLPSGGPDQDDHAGACRPRAGPGGTGPLRGSPGQARHGGRRGDCRAPGTHGCRPRQTRALRPAGSAWKSVLAATATAFTSPSHALFIDLACAWVCATGRRTICGMVAVMDPASRGAHDAYHRLVRAGAWSLDALWGVIVTFAVAHVGPGPIVVVLDDTLLHRPGRKVDGAGSWRDAVRSTANRVVHARGLNLVVLAVRINPPWGGMPIAVPVGVSLHRKGGDTLGRLAAALVRRREQDRSGSWLTWSRGEPGAVRVARRVRRAGWGNGLS